VEIPAERSWRLPDGTRSRDWLEWEMLIREMMTKSAYCVSPDSPITEAAGLMRVHDIGVVPVMEDNRVVGMLTDRDIVVQVVADGEDVANTPVSAAMSTGSITVFDDQDVDEAVALMQKYQVRRLPVLNRASELIGIVSLGDLAVDVHAGLSGKVLKEVSEPAKPLP
jgi:CBS domain-containing protein